MTGITNYIVKRIASRFKEAQKSNVVAESPSLVAIKEELTKADKHLEKAIEAMEIAASAAAYEPSLQDFARYFNEFTVELGQKKDYLQHTFIREVDKI